jgi:hypothetical protein
MSGRKKGLRRAEARLGRAQGRERGVRVVLKLDTDSQQCSRQNTNLIFVGNTSDVVVWMEKMITMEWFT